MAGPCQNKGWGGEKWSEKKAETDLNGRPPAKIRDDRVQGVGNGRRWDERKGRDGPKRPAPAKIRQL